jgi:hypothetical protein
MAPRNMTVTPDEEVLARTALRRHARRQIPCVASGMGAAGRGDELGSKDLHAFAGLGRLGTGLERGAGIAYRLNDRARLVSGGAKPALELLEQFDARRG